MNIEIKYDKETDTYYLDLEDLKAFIDVSKIQYYKLWSLKNQNLIIKFYDRKKKLLKKGELSHDNLKIP